MSLSGALYNAFSGLRANTRAAGLVSTNISNATTEGYGRRTLELTPGSLGTSGGVRIAGVIRHSDPVLVSDRRVSDASLAHSDTMYTYSKRLESLIGESDTAGSLVSRVTAFENSLLSAATNPASEQRLENVATAATSLTQTLNALSDEIQQSRQNADSAIADQVTTLNETLARLDQINGDMVKASSTGTDVATLQDERNRLLDSISSIVPLRVVERDRGEIALFTMNGAVLMDGSPVEIEFSEVNAIGAAMTLSAGDLNGLTVNGIPVNSTETGMFAGGSLAAQFEIRDVTAVENQAELDAIARDLIERLGPSGPDTTLGATDPGLFTDAGIAFDPLNEEGLAGRIQLNSLVAPDSGTVWRLRDGLGAATQGEVGDGRLLQSIAAALTEATVPSSASLPSVSRSFVNHISEYSSSVAGTRVRAENERSFLSAQNTALSELELSKGVDTDQELQNLMQIEQQYAANARVMTVVDELMERLMAI
ncbi:Flagellar hook-associated protein 1 [Pelagimonas phthalicica]|uniref:Flagellar hook-associated protein 1 n=1 Tax=Pelagimonas phthalicica TaxID=1037362 RepID=A0A238J6Y9_9RHOB|nr:MULTISPECIES: flagellar hook-associated protein FlgK [Roseobacteraceae]MBO9463853.1 flagellar hook-associated protein FlgK [Tropicibacter sp. R15_0]TDS95331.1 flagellar hook-associated protein 1 FlgK [Pelagimonas phthalicica]SMX26145.1 Flagellar hook-associated protein 1 [Pelagimonas phthalicica]